MRRFRTMRRFRRSRPFRFFVAGFFLLTIVVGVPLVVPRIAGRYQTGLAYEEARRAVSPPEIEPTALEDEAWHRFPAFRNRVPVLAYHGINDRTDIPSITPPAEFARQMRMLHEAGFHTISLPDYARYLLGHPVRLPSRPIVITFDNSRLDSWRAADKVLEQHGFVATMFVNAGATGSRDFNLSWDELREMQATGRWTLQLHAGHGHRKVPIGPGGRRGEFYAFRRLVDEPQAETRLETFGEYQARVTDDLLWGVQTLEREIPGYEPLAFSIPYANYGQDDTNDERIPVFLLNWLGGRFDAVFDGDYLHEPGGQRTSVLPVYRIVVRGRLKTANLYCRLRAFALGLALELERPCEWRTREERLYRLDAVPSATTGL
jgi:peptidoglycan/xylan/chitin deacetylase (PgdA/CDA1 family)